MEINQFLGVRLFLRSQQSFSYSKIPCLLRNPKVHYCFHKNKSMAPIMSQINPICMLPSYFFKIHLNPPIYAYVPYMYFFLQIYDHNFVCISHPHVCYMSRPLYPLWIYNLYKSLSGERYKLRLPPLYNFLMSPPTEETGHSGNGLHSFIFGRCFFTSAWASTILPEIFRCIPQSFQENGGLLLRSGRNHFPPNRLSSYCRQIV
jgi:hypothetical protein